MKVFLAIYASGSSGRTFVDDLAWVDDAGNERYYDASRLSEALKELRVLQSSGATFYSAVPDRDQVVLDRATREQAGVEPLRLALQGAETVMIAEEALVEDGEPLSPARALRDALT